MIVAPDTDEIALLSNDPSGKITANVASPTGLPLASTAKSVAEVSSTVTTVVEVTADNLPPLLIPALTGSWIFNNRTWSYNYTRVN